MIGSSNRLMIIDGGVMKNNILNEVVRYKNPKYKHRLDGFFWGFVLGYIPYLWHMYI